MPNLNCTTPEQSKVLIRLGLNAKTADCYWDYDVQKHEYYPMFMDDQYDDLCIPAWSLGALLELMPISITYKDRHLRLRMDKGETDFDVWYDNLDDGCASDIDFIANTPLDAVYEMMCWLMKEGYVRDTSK